VLFRSTYIPLKVNQAGVIPIIFASSVLYFPTLIASAVGGGFKNFVDRNIANQGSIAYIVLFGLMVVFFAYFYTAITFNPVDTADNIRKYGGFIPGIRPGKPTADHLSRILTRITLPGSLFLATIALIPSVVFAVWLLDPNTFPFGGTSILIVVGVALETMKQLESQLTMRHSAGVLRETCGSSSWARRERERARRPTGSPITSTRGSSRPATCSGSTCATRRRSG
jgi:preprotein translocase subunit SecY